MRRMSYQTFLLAMDRTRAEIVPERGALLTRLTVDGRDVLYMDYDTLADPSKSVRGGVPLLFPFAGALPDDRFTPAGTTIKQHGFGRNRAWRVVHQGQDRVRVRLESDDATRAVWPWDFAAEQTVRLLARGVQIDLVVENRGDSPMPAAPGWHPYFVCPTGQKREMQLDLPGYRPDLVSDDAVFDFGLAPAVGSRVRCQVPWLGGFTLEFSPRMRHVQLWSQPGKSFVCIEPFWGPAGAVLGPGRDEIPPGAAHDYWMRVELD
jgi:galactose mutarotase-like enzyme